MWTQTQADIQSAAIALGVIEGICWFMSKKLERVRQELAPLPSINSNVYVLKVQNGPDQTYKLPPTCRRRRRKCKKNI